MNKTYCCQAEILDGPMDPEAPPYWCGDCGEPCTSTGQRIAPLKLGKVRATPAALEEIGLAGILIALRRHALGDWGELDVHDKAANDEAAASEGRILSAYSAGRARFWIITDAERESTTALLPEEY